MRYGIFVFLDTTIFTFNIQFLLIIIILIYLLMLRLSLKHRHSYGLEVPLWRAADAPSAGARARLAARVARSGLAGLCHLALNIPTLLSATPRYNKFNKYNRIHEQVLCRLRETCGGHGPPSYTLLRYILLFLSLIHCGV